MSAIKPSHSGWGFATTGWLPLLEVAARDERARTTLRASVDSSCSISPGRCIMHHQRMGGRESVSAIHEVHEPFHQILPVHAAWDVGGGGGGACSERTCSNGPHFSSHPGENAKTDSAPGNSNPRGQPELAVGGRRRRVPAAAPRRRGGAAMSTNRAIWHGASAGCSQKAPPLGSERESSDSENPNPMTPPWPMANGSWPNQRRILFFACQRS